MRQASDPAIANDATAAAPAVSGLGAHVVDATAAALQSKATTASVTTTAATSDGTEVSAPSAIPASTSLERLRVAPAAQGEPEPLPISENAGRFRIVGELGGGGAARVYLAMARGPGGFNKLLVLKQPRPALLRIKAWRAAFLEEARLAARLNHPNIVQTYEVAEEQGIPHIVMEYLEGEPLSRIIVGCGDSLTLPMHLRIIADALAGLHYVHELTDYDGTNLGLVHRDISPQNVFVTFEGQVKLLDFGIAKASRSSTDTAPGLIKGKLHYMAPEQIAKDDIDRRSDVYSIGVMLWEALTGRRMWAGVADGVVLKRTILGDIPSLRVVRPDIPERLEAICAKALSVDRADRFASAAEFESELEAAIEQLDLRISNRAIAKMLSTTHADARTRTKRMVDELLANAEIEPPAGIEETKSVCEDNVGGGVTSSKLLLKKLAGRGDTHKAKPARAARAPHGGARLLLVAAATFAVFGLSIFWPARRSRPDPQAQEPHAGTGARTAFATAPSVAGEGTADPSIVRVRLSALPVEAKLYWDGEPLPGNPFEGTMVADSADHAVRAVAPGYDASQTSVRLESNVDITVALQRSRLERPPPFRARPAASAATKVRRFDYVEEM